MLQRFQLQLIGKGFFAGQKVFPLNVAVHHQNYSLVISHVPYKDGQFFHPHQLRRHLAPITADDLITAFHQPCHRRGEHTVFFYAPAQPVRFFILLYLESVVSKGL